MTVDTAALAGWSLRCHACAWTGPTGQRIACPRCGGSLLVGRDAEAPWPQWDSAASGVWRYRSWLPIAAQTAPVTLGEGATPLLQAPHVAPREGLLLKDETRNPTLAFKDRPVSVAVTAAREHRSAGLLCASTGNTAVAVAAYAARAGLPAVCLVPAGTPAAKLRMATAAGARLLAVDGTYSDAHALAAALAVDAGWTDLTTTYGNPFLLEGDKTLALELYEQLGGSVPAAVLVPVGAGPLLGGIAKAFDELRSAGWTDRVPRLFAVQAAGCAPIARAFASGEPVAAWTGSRTRAGAIADPLTGYAADGDRTLAAVRASGGAALAVDDDELKRAAADLARGEGLTVELAAAAGVAAYRRLRADGALAASETAVAVLTGHGAKDDVRDGEAAAVLGTVGPDGLDDARTLLGRVADA